MRKRKKIQNVEEPKIIDIPDEERAEINFNSENAATSEEYTRPDPRLKFSLATKIDKAFREQCLKESVRSTLSAVDALFLEFCRPLTTKDALFVLRTIIEAQDKLAKMLNYSSIVDNDDTSNVMCKEFYEAIKADVYNKLVVSKMIKDIHEFAVSGNLDAILAMSKEEMKKFEAYGYLQQSDRPMKTIDNTPSHLINTFENN